MSQVNRKRKPKFKKAREFSLAESDFIKQYKEYLDYYQTRRDNNSDRWYKNNLPYTTPYLERYQRFAYVRDKFNFLNSACTDEKLVPYFVTVTLPSQYHEFKINSNWELISEENQPEEYSELPDSVSQSHFEQTIKEGYNLLNQFLENMRKNFRVKREYVPVKYISVIEPHKSLIPHLHAVFYVPAGCETIFSRHFYNQVKLLGFNKERCEIAPLDNRGAIPYLLKYVSKTLLQMGSDNNWLPAYYTKNGFRQYKTSSVELNRGLWNASHWLIDYGKDNFYTGFKKIKIALVDSLDNVVFNKDDKIIYKVNHFSTRQILKKEIFEDYVENPAYEFNPFEYASEVDYTLKKNLHCYTVPMVVNRPTYHSRSPLLRETAFVDPASNIIEIPAVPVNEWNEYIEQVRISVDVGVQRMRDYLESIPF